MSPREQARWWMRTAEGDLDAARLLTDAGRHNLAAFHSQQAAEKALKALLARRGRSFRTHAATDLVRRLTESGVDAPEGLTSGARRLDLHYVQSRYPNGLGGDPTDYYDSEIAAEAIKLAEGFLRFARTHLDADGEEA